MQRKYSSLSSTAILTMVLILASLLVITTGCGLATSTIKPVASPIDAGLTSDEGGNTAPTGDEKTSATAPSGAGSGSTEAPSTVGKPAATPSPVAALPAAEEPAAPPSSDERDSAASEAGASPMPEDFAGEGTVGDTTRPRPQGQPAALKAGERDDNETFTEYLDYLATYQGMAAHTVDVSERSIITVLDTNQRPILNALVKIYAGDTEVFQARTYAGGKTIFLPRVRNVSENAQEFRIVAEYGNETTEKTVPRDNMQAVELSLGQAATPDTVNLDILFLLDTTGSMSDELGHIQETIDSIAQRIDAFTPRPNLRFGLVAYRDRGDDYVTRSYDLTPDIATFRKQLNSFSADGGGDTPESLSEALHEAVQNISWSDENAIRLVFLVADAGPHLDYAQDYDYITETQQAVTQGIKIYPIAASNTDSFAEYVFRQLAQQTLAHFIFLTYQSGESAGTPGEDTTLEAGDQPYTVERLDDLIVQVVQRELAMASGRE